MKISAIIVTYNPDFSLLRNCVASLLPQVDSLVVVNNGTAPLSAVDLSFGADESAQSKLHIIELGKNYGIAYAQNRGIEYAFSKGADFVLFSDQDTVYPSDFVEKSLDCFERHKSEKVAAVVPLFYNENKKQYAEISISKTRVVSAKIGNEYEVSHAISSGTVAKAQVLKDVGMMNERLFIDWVDTEWCWRTAKFGYKIIQDTKIVIHHSMGENFKSVFGKKIVVYSDFRNFFFFRNGTWLLFHSHLFSAREWFGFAKFMLIKSILFFMTSGFSVKHIFLFLRAVLKGMTNKFSLEEVIK